MLLLLAEYLQQFYKGFAVFQYLSLRGILGVLTALTLSLCLGPWMIRTLQNRQIGQSVRNDGPQSHLSKSGTPTMGGALILSAIAISTLLWADLSNRYVWVVLIVTLLFGAIGWVDDYRKVIEKNSRGLPSRWKYFWQSVFGLGAAIFLYVTAPSAVETTLILPILKDASIPLGIGFVVLTYFVIVGSSNAVNLTDGLDGQRLWHEVNTDAREAALLLFCPTPSQSLAGIFEHVQTFLVQLPALIDNSAELGNQTLAEQFTAQALPVAQAAELLWQAQLAGHSSGYLAPLQQLIQTCTREDLQRAAGQLNDAVGGWRCVANGPPINGSWQTAG